jgi:O-antigen/teichoic acid export membrane protein
MAFLQRFTVFLVPSVLEMVVTIAMIPITTYRLDPEDFGIFAVATVIASLGTAIAFMGYTFLLAAHFSTADEAGKRALVSSILNVSLLVLTLFSLAVMLGWSLLASVWRDVNMIPPAMLLLSLLGMFLNHFWLIAVEIITLQGEVFPFAKYNLVRLLVTAAATIIGLYVFDLDFRVLFISTFLGTLILWWGAIRLLRPYYRWTIDWHWAREILLMGLPTNVGNLVDRLQNTAEGYMLSTHLGLATLGLYNHSQRYRSMLMLAITALSRSVWPVALEEAREPNSRFEKTLKAWGVVYLGLTVLGMGFAVYGKYLISFLTHNKFTQAAPLVTLWIVVLIIQGSGKPAYSTLNTLNKGRLISTLLSISMGFGILVLVIAVPPFGMAGAVMAVFGQFMFWQLLMQGAARRWNPHLPWDRWSAIGVLCVLMTLGLSLYFGFGFWENTLLLLGMYGVVLVAFYPLISDLRIYTLELKQRLWA